MAAADWPPAEVAGCVGQVLRARRAVRAYQPWPVPEGVVREILRDAATAPSGGNIQPWRVYVLTGSPMKALGDALVAASRAGEAPAPAHFPDPLPEAFRAHVADFATRYYGSLGIAREDTAARLVQTQRNFSFFGAPLGLIFSIDRRLKAHSWLDLGLFLQNVMIAAQCRGIATCPQVAFAPFHAVVAAQLQMPEDELTVCGMSMGFADMDATVNQVRMPREPVEAFARLMGFEAPVPMPAHP